MNNSERGGDDVIDLTEARNRGRSGGDAHQSVLSRHSAGATPPWRSSSRSSIVERPAQPDTNGTFIEPAQLRRSLFESDERVISAQELEFKAAPDHRALGKPNGTLLQRLRRRR